MQASTPIAQKGAFVRIVTIHPVGDPAGFQKAEAEALEKGIPPEFKLPIHSATKDHSQGIRVWSTELLVPTATTSITK